MASRRRPGFDKKAGFRQCAQEPTTGVHPQLLKSARASGQLNLSSRHLSEVPDSVWRINLDVPEEAKCVSLDNTEDRWWDQVDLTKLILASNIITALSEDIINLPALTVLDVHDNKLTSLPRAVGDLRNLLRLNISHNELTSLPECIGKLLNLNTLHVQNNQISELGTHIGNLFVLEDLDVSNNQLTDLPMEIGYLTKLFKLNISKNTISRLPLSIGDIASLRFLDCTHNKLKGLPEDVGRLTHLEQLYLRHNQLPALPVLLNCTNLKELHVGNNALTVLTPVHLAHLRQVSVLDIRDNKIQELPEEITLLEGLQRLDLSNNDLSALPYSLGTMVNLKSVILDGNPMKSVRRDIIMRGTTELKKYLASRIEEPASGQPNAPPTSNVRNAVGTSGIIGHSGDGVDPHAVGVSKTLDYSEKRATRIPEEVWDIAVTKEVQKVNLNKNAFTQWPAIFAPLSNSLRELSLGFNKLPSVGRDIGELHQLVFLDLRNNVLSSLPDEIGGLPNLREITLSYNRLKVLPPALYRCRALENILASDNQIEAIDPEGLRDLPKLATLDLQNNNLSQVPPTLGNVTQLRSLMLEGNAFRVPRPAILTKGTLAVLDFLRGRIAQ